MRNIQISVPEYNDCLQLEWEYDFKIKVSNQSDTLKIEANKGGLVSLARHLLLLAQEDVPNGSHIHLDEFNSLEDNSIELILSKKEDL